MRRTRTTLIRLLALGVLALAPALTQQAPAATDYAAATFDITFETMAPYYEPRVAVVGVGAPVRWWNTTASPHSIRHDDCLDDGPCAFRSVAVPPDDSFVLAPLPPGRYTYHCELHPIMRGVLVVTDGQGGLERERTVAETER